MPRKGIQIKKKNKNEIKESWNCNIGILRFKLIDIQITQMTQVSSKCKSQQPKKYKKKKSRINTKYCRLKFLCSLQGKKKVWNILGLYKITFKFYAPVFQCYLLLPQIVFFFASQFCCKKKLITRNTGASSKISLGGCCKCSLEELQQRP